MSETELLPQSPQPSWADFGTGSGTGIRVSRFAPHAPQVTRVATVLALSLLPAPAQADSALLWGFSAGGAVSARPGTPARPAFKLGTGLDWLHESGATLQSRLETTHRIDTSLALLLGWSLDGLRSNAGVPLGFSLGGVVSLDPDGVTRAGGRWQLALGLWYSRALVELDVTLRRRLTPHGDRRLFDLEVVAGLTLRVVPWAPFRL